jgi:hypothetical protein
MLSEECQGAITEMKQHGVAWHGMEMDLFFSFSS